jgi:hypothetical protein
MINYDDMTLEQLQNEIDAIDNAIANRAEDIVCCEAIINDPCTHYTEKVDFRNEILEHKREIDQLENAKRAIKDSIANRVIKKL